MSNLLRRASPVLLALGMLVGLALAGCSAANETEPPAADVQVEDDAPQDAVGLFDAMASASDLGAFLETAGVDPDALATCQTVLPNAVGSGVVSALPATFGDALDASLIFQTDPNWPYATGDDNRMTVRLRDVEDPAGPTALCVYAMPIDPYTRDVIVVFSDVTWGEIGAY